jgi:hypothetical protein
MFSDYIDHPAESKKANHKTTDACPDKQRPTYDEAGELRQVAQKFP